MRESICNKIVEEDIEYPDPSDNVGFDDIEESQEGEEDEELIDEDEEDVV